MPWIKSDALPVTYQQVTFSDLTDDNVDFVSYAGPNLISRAIIIQCNLVHLIKQECQYSFFKKETGASNLANQSIDFVLTVTQVTT
jgi:hypothetical protein